MVRPQGMEDMMADALDIRVKPNRVNKVIHFADGVSVIALERRDGSIFPCYIDTADYPIIAGCRWRIKISQTNNSRTAYALTNLQINGQSASMKINQMILGVRHPKIECDHWDECGLNNRRENLRLSDRKQNGSNVRKRDGAYTSKFKGVCRRGSTWRAYIVKNGKQTHLGIFPSEAMAAEAYNQAAIALHKEFSNLNILETI